jgi:CheY-like chemotaxis protein
MAHILIVDDEATIRFLLRTMLEAAGHGVFEAQSGRAALDIIETFPKPFDMITLDIYMPRMNGFEFLSTLQIKPFHPRVLVVSAHSDEIPQALAHQVSGRLMKPFRQQELIATVNRLVNQSTRRDAPIPIDLGILRQENAKTNRL